MTARPISWKVLFRVNAVILNSNANKSKIILSRRQSTVHNEKYDECAINGLSLKENLVGIDVLYPLIVAANEVND